MWSSIGRTPRPTSTMPRSDFQDSRTWPKANERTCAAPRAWESAFGGRPVPSVNLPGDTDDERGQ